MNRPLLDYYQKARDSLLRDGAAFARQHPRIANHLLLEEDRAQDPHVERLLEGVAWLTARVERKLDDELPEVTDALLGVIYPHLTAPIPSLAIVQVEPDREQALGARGIEIPRGSTFVSRSVRDVALRFRTTSAMTVHAIAVEHAEIRLAEEPGASAVLRIVLRADGEHDFGAMECASLPLYLHGPDAGWLYEAVTVDALRCRWRSDAQRPDDDDLPAAACLRLRGLGPEHAALPWPARSFEGYRALLEYFAFPEKAMFVDLTLPRGRSGRRLELDVLLRRRPAQGRIQPDTLRPFCVPVVNLFERVADPIALDDGVGDHRVVPDASRPLAMEVHSLQRVRGVTAGATEHIAYDPFYSLRRDAAADAPRAFWHATRRPSPLPGDAGHEVHLHLLDQAGTPARLDGQTVVVEALCTNRDLPHRVRQWGGDDDLVPERIAGLRCARAIRHPTAPRRPPLGADAAWRLISHLALNRLSLVQGGRTQLQALLRVYDLTGDAANAQQIEGIVDLQAKAVVRRLHTADGLGYAQGTQVDLTLDRSRFVGASPVLFGAVLNRFLALYCATNAFVQVVLHVADGPGDDHPDELHRWPPQTGEQVLL